MNLKRTRRPGPRQDVTPNHDAASALTGPQGHPFAPVQTPHALAQAHTQAQARAPAVALRPLAAGDERELRRIHSTAEVARWWDLPDERFPWEEPESTRLTIVVDGTIAGLIQFQEELEPRYRHAAIDLFLDPALHGRGIGSEAVHQLVDQLISAHGHHRITIDPAATNAVAIRAYEKVGFRPVGVMCQAERDIDGEGWHDSLLMELLASDR